MDSWLHLRTMMVVWISLKYRCKLDDLFIAWDEVIWKVLQGNVLTTIILIGHERKSDETVFSFENLTGAKYTEISVE